ncbi:Nitrilase [Deinococcus marmoris]|uniref:Nitrilase n=1 Tax=Deinococcus marmoris TaxID=249408 RepID=A0A1U7NR08_9DEIO|nr:nitrilase-related carbon-nitrogen hydrolase [Deinococcus marmoris]OLV15348.1 Nitrilase [Deinococcus marmoris]
MTHSSTFNAAACHVSPIYFDLDATIDKTCDLIAEAARNGAKIVAFPEAHICAFPVWSGVRAPVENHDFFVRMVKSAVTIDHPAIDRVRRAAGSTTSWSPSVSTRRPRSVWAASGTPIC